MLNGAAIVTEGKPGATNRDYGHSALPQHRGGGRAVKNVGDRLSHPREKAEANSPTQDTPGLWL